MSGSGPRAVPVSAGPDEFERFERALTDPRRTDAAVVGHLRRMLAEQRRAEDALGPRRLLPPVLAQVGAIDVMARDARGPVHRELLGSCLLEGDDLDVVALPGCRFAEAPRGGRV